jgi:hypothetical protein
MDFSQFAGCAITLGFKVWVDADNGFDGGNLQITDDPAMGSSSWKPVGSYPGTMGYDSKSLSNASCSACFIAGQPVWTGHDPNVKTASADLTAYAGKPAVTLRFTFHSDNVTQYDGIYVFPMTITAK